MLRRRKRDTPKTDAERQIPAVSRLDKRSLRNWFLFVATAVVTTLGLAAAVLIRLGDRITSPWPWENTDVLLLGGLSVSILLFAGYMTFQQRWLMALRLELFRADKVANQRMRAYLDRLVALLNVSRVLATATDPQAVFDAITKNCLNTFGCQQASLFLYNNATEDLEVRSVSGHDEGARELARVQKIGRGIIGWVAEKRRPFVLGREITPAVGRSGAEGGPLPAAAIVVPIILRDELVGVLSVSSSLEDTNYTDEDLQALQLFAETAGICCRHAEQTDWMRQTIQRLDASLQERAKHSQQRAA